MAEIAELIFEANTSSLSKVTKILDEIQTSSVRTEKSTESFKSQIDKMTASLARQESIMGKTTDEIELYDLAVKGATKEDLLAVAAIQKKRAALMSASNDSNAYVGTLGRMSSSFKVQSNAAQVAAFQIQDFAVQVGSGQSAMTAFTQQAPQFLGVFGAGGAILGTIVAITSAIGGPLIRELFNTDEATDILAASLAALNDIIDQTDGKTDALSDSFAKLAQKSAILSQAQVREALLKTEDALDAANKEALSLAESLSPNDLGGRFEDAALKIGMLRAQFIGGNIDLEEFNEKVSDLFLQTEDPSKDFRKVREELSKISSEAESAAKTRDILLGGTGGLSSRGDQDDADEALELELKRQAKLAEARARLAAEEEKQRIAASRARAILDANAENQRIAALDKSYYQIEDSLRSETQVINDSYNERLAIVRAYNAQNLVDKESAAEIELQLERKKTEQLAKIQETELQNQKDVQAANINATGDLFTALATLTAGEGKKSFERSKKLAIAGAVIKGIQATVNAYEEGSKTNIYLGAAYAAIAAATTGAQIAQIKGQQYAGRALGGQVRPGQSYRVGEYGPETLVMGSNGGTIVPKGAANDSGSSVIVNVTVEGGTGGETVERSKSTDNQGRLIENIIVKMANDKTSGLMKGVFANSTAMPRGSR